MFWLRSCPKCSGDLYDGADMYGRYIACVQCGYYLTESEEIVLRYTSRHPSVTRSQEAATKVLIRAAA